MWVAKWLLEQWALMLLGSELVLVSWGFLLEAMLMGSVTSTDFAKVEMSLGFEWAEMLLGFVWAGRW